jgi:hypothetical protein
MSDKVIPGISRASLKFIIENWKGLIIVSLLPVTILAIIGYLAMHAFGGFLDVIGSIDPQTKKMPVEVLRKYFQLMPQIFGTEIVGLIVIVWLYVRIVRFWNNREARVWIDAMSEFSATGYTILYAIAIMFLTGIAYLAIVLVSIIAALIVFFMGKLFFGFYIFMVPLLLCAYFSLVCVACRFYVGLPGVALGRVPNFFPDIWELSKGETFAVPARLLLTLMMIAIPFMALFLIFVYPVMHSFQETIQNSPTHQVSPEILQQLFKAMLPIQLIGIIPNLFMMIYFSVFMAEAYSRFRTRKI